MRPRSVRFARPGASCLGNGDRAGRDAAHAHLGRERAREDAGQLRLRRLRGGVRREVRPRQLGGDVFDHQQQPHRRTQVRRARLRDEERALRRDADGGIPVGLGHLADRLNAEAGRGTVDHDVEPTELARRALDERLRIRRGRKVAVGRSGGQHVPALLAQAGCERRAELSGAAGQQAARVWFL